MRPQKRLAALLLTVGAIGATHAAQQCFTTPNTYGAVTVTESAGCALNNPFVFGGRTGFAITVASTCTLTFSKPLLTSSFTIDLDGNGTNDATTISTSAGAYTVIPADITAPLVPAGSPGSIAAVSGKIDGNGSGTFRFTNAPPASITSLSIAIVPGAGGTFYRVCADDGAGGGAAQVPTLSQWAMLLLAAGLLLAGALGSRKLGKTVK